MEFKKSKLILSVAMILGFLIWLCAPVSALDSFQIYPDFIYRSISTGDVRYNNYGTVSDVDYIGMDLSFPVPDHADGDHYSVYIRYYFTLPAGDDELAQRLVCGPLTLNDSIPVNYIGGTVVNNLNNTFDRSMKSIAGTFSYLGSNTCTYDLCYSRLSSGPETYFCIAGILDFNLVDEIENYPCRLGVYFPTATSGFTVYNSYGYCYTMDTHKEEYLIDIEQAINNLDFSVDLSTLESQVANIFSWDVNFSSDLMNVLESDSPDPEVTEWVEKASVFESKNVYLHDLEESLEGTIEDFTFPQVANQTAVQNVVGNFFANEFVIALTLAMMALMIVFLIL